MLDAYFGFSCSPFENTLDQRFMFLSRRNAEITAALLSFVQEKKSFAFLCGEVGTGKTMIVHHLLGKLPPSVLPVLIPYPAVEFIEILRYVARALKVDLNGKKIAELTNELKAALTKASIEGRQVLLIIDEAHNLPISSLENISILSNIEITEKKLLQILLTGQSELGLKLQRSEIVRQLLKKLNFHRLLSLFSPSETIEYIDHRLKIAGSSFDKCFKPDCKKQIYEMTDGVARSINRLCDTALLICMVEKEDLVTEWILKKAHDVITSSTGMLYTAFEMNGPAVEKHQLLSEYPPI